MAPRRTETAADKRQKLTASRDQAERALAAYNECLADMRKRRSQYSHAIGCLEATMQDAEERVSNSKARLEAMDVAMEADVES